MTAGSACGAGDFLRGGLFGSLKDAEEVLGQLKRGLRAGAPETQPGTSDPARKKALFLLAGARFLGGPEGNSSAHGLLLNRGSSPAELAGDRARGSSRLGELFQGT